MLAWVKSLIKLRRSRVCFNDGDMHHLGVQVDEHKGTLTMVRDEARMLSNFGDQTAVYTLLVGESLAVVSRDGITVHDNQLELPPMTFAALLSTSEDAEDRQVTWRTQEA